ncbi:MAG: hypothetical protein ACLQPN_24695 [Bryobacteraceae bacterium]
MHRIAVAVVALGLLSVAEAAEAQPAKQLQRRGSVPGRRIRQLHFSPDGRYVLAQDDWGLTVLTVQPFSVLFRIPAANITYSGFTPDSRQVLCLTFRIWVTTPPAIFAGPSEHLERWSVADRARVESVEIPNRDCKSWGLSPDGRFFTCHDSNGTLSLVDVASSATIFRRKNFSDYREVRDFSRIYHRGGDLGAGETDFSPDGRFVLALPRNALGSALAWDLQQKKRVSLTFRLKTRLANWGQFAFTAPDRLLISRATLVSQTVTAALVAFPSGKVLSKPKLPPGPIYRAADPNFVIVRPFAAASFMDLNSNSPKRSAAVEIRTGQVIVCDSPALDVFGQYYAAERTDGELGLYKRGKGLQATVMIADKL